MPAAPEGGGTTGSTQPRLTLVVPAYNEAARLDAGLERLRRAAASVDFDLGDVELLVVDDGSRDDTAEHARRGLEGLRGRVLSLPKNLGKGAAVRTGLLAASGRAVAFADADMAIDPVHLPELLAALERADVAVGSRAVRGHVDYGSWPRTVAGRCFNLAVRAFGGVDLPDTQCGFKGFNRGPALLLAHLLTTNGYAFDVELLWLAGRLGLSIEVVPVTWLDVEGSSVRPLHDAFGMLLDVLEARRRHRVLAVTDAAAAPGATAPKGAVRVRTDDGELLLAGAPQLAALRAAVDGARVRFVRLDELAGQGLHEVVPA